jgi:putative drug exporter of the RND superfamily
MTAPAPPATRSLKAWAAPAGWSSAPNTDIKVFATALGAGILLDATVVRALLVPATVALFGRWNWWLPGPLARILPARPTEVPKVPSPSGVGESTGAGWRHGAQDHGVTGRSSR